MVERAKAKASSRRSASKTGVASKKAAGARGNKLPTKKKKTAARAYSIAKKRARVPESSATKKVKTKTAVKANNRGATKLKTSKSAGERVPPATSHDPILFPEEQRALPRTCLTHGELADFAQLLLRKRSELAGDVEHLAAGASNSKGRGGTDHSSMPIHMADLGSDNWEQEFTLSLIANEQDRIREIDDALARIKDKTYGICLATRKRISLARLRAKPWAKYCIQYARAREEGRAL